MLLTPAIPVLRTSWGRAILQGHPQSCGKFEGSLDYKTLCLKQNEKPTEPLSSCLVFGNCFCRLGDGHNTRRVLGTPELPFPNVRGERSAMQAWQIEGRSQTWICCCLCDLPFRRLSHSFSSWRLPIQAHSATIASGVAGLAGAVECLYLEWSWLLEYLVNGISLGPYLCAVRKRGPFTQCL